MKFLRYDLCTIDDITGEEIHSPVFMRWSELNEEIAKREAHNGEYTIEDDGQPEPEATPTTEEQVAELREALDLLLSGVTE